jgi:hypothetical protein
MAQETRINNFVIEVMWDNDAKVWVSESDGISGLITEGDSRTHLIEKLAIMIPELLELNDRPSDPSMPIDPTLRFHRDTEQREERISLPKAA